VNALVRLLIGRRSLGLCHVLTALLLAWAYDYRGFIHGFVACLTILWVAEQYPRKPNKVICLNDQRK